MGFQDRSYYRDSQHDRSGALMWLLTGSLHLFTVAGIRVRMHAATLLIAIIYLAAGTADVSFPQRLLMIGVLFAVVLLHELGRCCVSRLLGGYAEEVQVWPLGSLAEIRPPSRPAPAALTIAAGPVVNALICAACWAALRLLHSDDQLTMAPFALAMPASVWADPRFYLAFTFNVSYVVLLLNLLPILPLDGGRMLHCAIWPFAGYGRALLYACNVGIVLSAGIGLFALVTGRWLLFGAMLACLLICLYRRSAVRTAGIWSYDEYDVEVRRPRRHRLGRFTKWRARRQIRREEVDRARVDEILAKVYSAGMQSLNWREKRTLRRATQRQRQREMEESYRPV